MSWRGLFLAGALLAGAGCASPAELRSGINEDLRFTSKIMGFALDARVESLRLRIALLKAYKKDPRLPRLKAELGTIEENEARLRRLQAVKEDLLREYQRLIRRYPADGAPPALAEERPEPAPKPTPKASPAKPGSSGG